MTHPPTDRRSVECWWDYGAPDGRTRKRLEALRSYRMTGLRIMVNREAIRVDRDTVRRPRDFEDSLKMSAEECDALICEALDVGFDRIHVTVWPQSSQPESFAELARYLATWKDEPSIFFELDCEGYGWYDAVNIPHGLWDAGHALRSALESEGIDVSRVSATTYPGAISIVYSSLKWVRRWTPQAYSQTRYGWEGRYGVGGMQRTAATKMRIQADPPDFDMGLAAYRQDFDEAVSLKHTLAKTFRSAWTTGASSVCYWSAKALDLNGVGETLREILDMTDGELVAYLAEVEAS